MDALIWLLPIAIVLGALFVGLFLAAVGQGQFDDMDEDARRALEED